MSRSFRQSNYRALVDKSMWLAAWRSVKRAHKDKRARKHILMVTAALGLLVLLVAGCLVYLVFVIGTGAWIFVPFVIPVMWWIRRGAKQEFAPMNIAPPPEPLLPHKNERDKVITYFSKLALLYAVLVDRSGSEGFLKQKELPEGFEVTTRRSHLELLKSLGIWDNLSPADREAIMLPDGQWSWDRINIAAGGIEPIRSLRWILRVDFSLPFIAMQISTDVSMAHDLVVNPQPILTAADLVEIDALRSAREQAHVIFLRCLAESISRGYVVPAEPKMIEWANNVSTSLRGNQNEDFLIGNGLVSEATEEQLSWTSTLAKTRYEFMTMAESVIDGNAPVPQNFEGVFAKSSSRWNSETSEAT